VDIRRANKSNKQVDILSSRYPSPKSFLDRASNVATALAVSKFQGGFLMALDCLCHPMG
jgi:hypothetical protein